VIYVIRHGQTKLNNAKLLQGRSDLPLNETGMEQAREAGRWLAGQGVSFQRVYSSPLVRAIQTAELVAPGVPVVADDRLIEMDYGPYEGSDLQNPAPEIIEFFSDFVHNPAPDGMEQLSEVVARTGEFVEELKGTSDNVLISTHAIAMKGILEYLTPTSGGSYWSKYVGNCEVYVIDSTASGFGVPERLGIAGETKGAKPTLGV
jgi:broad specificity phosphatase PhoE